MKGRVKLLEEALTASGVPIPTGNDSPDKGSEKKGAREELNGASLNEVSAMVEKLTTTVNVSCIIEGSHLLGDVQTRRVS